MKNLKINLEITKTFQEINDENVPGSSGNLGIISAIDKCGINILCYIEYKNARL